MNPHFEAHLKEVHTWYNSGDTSLALRRLTDSAIETQNVSVFAETIRFYEWLEGKKETPQDETREKAFSLLEKISNAGVKSADVGISAPNKILTVKNVHKQYSNSGFKIKNLNFNLNDRQITGLVGENGNGKTTLLRLLAAELKPDSGTINYDFSPRADQYDLRAKLIYIEQRIPRWYGTLMDNLKFVLPYYGIKGDNNHLWAEIMIARLGLRPYRHLTWSRLSSGYRTRFELAKTLLR
ncbi:MAG TPA: ATP-binding cassette domain-containing protein, partial [Bacteroidia bacterium]|nr:ATP-binding cassette domain-containing protein [Bacteroidia bacterium]